MLYPVWCSLLDAVDRMMNTTDQFLSIGIIITWNGYTYTRSNNAIVLMPPFSNGAVFNWVAE